MRKFAPRIGFGLAALAIAAAASSAATAQVQQLPETSRSEAQVNSLNRSMMQQQQDRAVSQQNRFETNSLQTQIRSQPVSPPVVAAPPVAPPPHLGR